MSASNSSMVGCLVRMKDGDADDARRFNVTAIVPGGVVIVDAATGATSIICPSKLVVVRHAQNR